MEIKRALTQSSLPPATSHMHWRRSVLQMVGLQQSDSLHSMTCSNIHFHGQGWFNNKVLRSQPSPITTAPEFYDRVTLCAEAKAGMVWCRLRLMKGWEKPWPGPRTTHFN